MECSCVPIGSDYCDTRVLSVLRQKARKEHYCNECHNEIRHGDTYERARVLCEDLFHTQKICMSCLSIRQVFFCDGWIYENLIWDLKDHIFECGGLDSDKIALLKNGARGVVCDLIEEYWKETEEEE